MFGVCLLPTWVATFVFGCVIAWFSNSSAQTIQQFCSESEQDSVFVEWGRDFVHTYDDDIGQLVNEIMCSRECPCPDVFNKNDWLETPEHELNAVGRTSFAQSALYEPFDFSGEAATIYRKFRDCYKDILRGNTSRVQPELAEFRNRFEENNLDLAIDFANYFEEQYKCSGICKSALFYYSLSVTEGIPDKVCLLYLKEEV